METSDITIEILKDIRGELRGIGDEARKTNELVDVLEVSFRGELKELRESAKVTEIRLATELVAVAGAVREVRDLLRDDLALRGRVEDHERRIAAIERRAD